MSHEFIESGLYISPSKNKLENIGSESRLKIIQSKLRDTHNLRIELI